jgi:predicted amidohydrolase YtcJ
MTTRLFRGGRVRTASERNAFDWLLIDGPDIVGVGLRGDEPPCDEVIDLAGATLLPAFCDAHVHLPATGLYAAGMNFRGQTSAAAILDEFGRRASQDAVLFGGNFEDPLDEPLTRYSLDRVVGERPALLARADMHSCVVSSALLNSLDVTGLPGVDVDDAGVPTGYLREQAAGAAWRWFDANLPATVQKDAVRAAVRLAYSRGVSQVHDMYVVEWRGWNALEPLLEVVDEVRLDVVSYIATTEVSRVAAMGLDRIGGDWFLDGSFGSHTAWLSEPYDPLPPVGSPPSGIAYRSDDEVVDFFAEAQHAGMQTAVHAIGDAAIEQALAAWETVARTTGVDEIRALGHRIEHFECSTDDHIGRAARLNLGISIQPAFDRFWGGADGLYARRMGWPRAEWMNRFGAMVRAGLVVGAGSDSTVTPLDPFLQMAALRAHHVPDEQLDPHRALWAHTGGARALAGGVAPDGGAGSPADLVVVDRDPIDTDPDELPDSEVLGTWIGGARVWPPGEAEEP